MAPLLGQRTQRGRYIHRLRQRGYITCHLSRDRLCLAAPDASRAAMGMGMSKAPAFQPAQRLGAEELSGCWTMTCCCCPLPSYVCFPRGDDCICCLGCLSCFGIQREDGYFYTQPHMTLKVQRQVRSWNQHALMTCSITGCVWHLQVLSREKMVAYPCENPGDGIACLFCYFGSAHAPCVTFTRKPKEPIFTSAGGAPPTAQTIQR